MSLFYSYKTLYLSTTSAGVQADTTGDPENDTRPYTHHILYAHATRSRLLAHTLFAFRLYLISITPCTFFLQARFSRVYFHTGQELATLGLAPAALGFSFWSHRYCKGCFTAAQLVLFGRMAGKKEGDWLGLVARQWARGGWGLGLVGVVHSRFSMRGGPSDIWRPF